MQVSLKVKIRYHIIVLSGLLLLNGSCMKHACYECKNDTGVVVAKGCDKTREEVKEYAESTGYNCNILPD